MNFWKKRTTLKFGGVTAKELLKKSHKKITVERLRTYPGFEDISDEDGEYILKTLSTLAKIIIKTAPAMMAKQEAEAAKLK